MQKYFTSMVLVIFVLLLTGCTNVIDALDQPTPAPQVYEPTAVIIAEEPEIVALPSPGGVLRLSMREPTTLNPLLNGDATVARALQLMYEPLVVLDDNLRPVPHLLSSLEFALNGMSVIVTIREDARWSNGRPVTAHDLIHSVEVLQNAPEGAVYKHQVENFAELEALDYRTVRIVFNRISGGSAFYFNFPIIPHFYEEDEPPVGNGPFVLRSYEPTSDLTFIRNPYTFRSRPYIEEIQILITADSVTDLHAFDRGLVDIYLSTIPAWARHHSVKPVHFSEFLAMHYEFIGFNHSRYLPQMWYFRNAIAHSIDTETLISNIFLTHAAPTKGAVHPDSWLNTADIPTHEYNPQLAASLAAQALRAIDSEYEALPLTVLVNEENVERVRIARTLVTQMNGLGFYTELVSLPFDDFILYLQEGNFDLFVSAYNLSQRPDLRFAFHSESPENILHYHDSELDRLLEFAAATSTESGFYRAISDIQLHMARELPVISLAFRHSAIILGRHVQGNIAPSACNVFINVEEWFIQ